MLATQQIFGNEASERAQKFGSHFSNYATSRRYKTIGQRFFQRLILTNVSLGDVSVPIGLCRFTFKEKPLAYSTTLFGSFSQMTSNFSRKNRLQ